MTLDEIKNQFKDSHIVMGGKNLDEGGSAAPADVQRERALDAIEGLFNHPRVQVVATTFFAPIISGFRLQANPERTLDSARWLLDHHKTLFDIQQSGQHNTMSPDRNTMRSHADLIIQAAKRHTAEVPDGAEADLSALAAFQARAAARQAQPV